MSLKGVIIEESLKDNRMLNDITITAVRISKEEEPQSRWHVYTVLVGKQQIESIAKNLKEGTWYTHFWDNQGNVTAIFSGSKVFDFNYHNKQTWEAAIAYGLKLGIPKDQLDFPID